MKYKKIIEGTLNWCNKIRKQKGLYPVTELPKGNHHMDECPCGKVTGVSVGTDFYAAQSQYSDALIGSGTAKPLPKVVKQFVALFDDGKIPQYLSDECLPDDCSL